MAESDEYEVGEIVWKVGPDYSPGTPEGDIVWEYIDGFGNQEPLLQIYRAYRIPPEWVPGNPSGYTSWSGLYE